MNDASSFIFKAIEDSMADEPAFFRYTSPLLWNDPWISAHMLKTHLDPTTDLASRNPGFIDASVDFLCDRFGIGKGTDVVDFGCGPGLYASRIAKKGAHVAGIDLSENSLAYAKSQAEAAGLSIQYIQGDYLESPAPFAADLAIMIYCDLGVFGPERLKQLLARVKSALKPDGVFFFDVMSLSAFEGAKEERSWSFERSGFFSPRPHATLFERKKFPEACAFRDRHIILEEGMARVIDCWNVGYSPQSIGKALEDSGFRIDDVWADAKGTEYSADSPTMAVAARLSDHL